MEGTRKEELAQKCGMTKAQLDRGSQELVGQNLLRKSQSRPYTPNRYEIRPLLAALHLDSSAQGSAESSDSWGSVSEGSPQPPCKGAGAPVSLPAYRRSRSAGPSPESEIIPFDAPLRSLVTLAILPPVVWRTILLQETLSKCACMYFAHRFFVATGMADRIDESYGTRLVEFVESGGLNSHDVYEALRSEIEENPIQYKSNSGESINLKQDELAALDACFACLGVPQS